MGIWTLLREWMKDYISVSIQFFKLKTIFAKKYKPLLDQTAWCTEAESISYSTG